MPTLYLSTTFQPKMIERDLITYIEETNLIDFKKAFTMAGEIGYQIKFAVTSSASTEKLISILDLSIKGNEIVGESINSEDVKYGDIVLLAEPTQSSVFRYFVITLHMKKNL